MISRHTLIRSLLLVAALATGSFVTYYFYSDKLSVIAPKLESGIFDYDPQKDYYEIIDIFVKDRYWLVSSPDYDTSFMLNTKSPNKTEEKYFGKLIVKVCRKEGKFIGFCAYYMKNFFEGFILFLAVKTEFRGQRCGPSLIEYAFADLKKRGAHCARLVTRTSNIKAQAVYKRTGFTETSRDQDYVYYCKNLIEHK